MNLNLTYTKKYEKDNIATQTTGDMELIGSYGTPLAQRASYLALHSSLSGPVVQLIMSIILS